MLSLPKLQLGEQVSERSVVRRPVSNVPRWRPIDGQRRQTTTFVRIVTMTIIPLWLTYASSSSFFLASLRSSLIVRCFGSRCWAEAGRGR